MEFVDGGPLAPVGTPDRLLDIAAQIADGLAARTPPESCTAI